MKFLVLSTPIPGLPPPEDPEAFFNESRAYLDALLEDGTADCIHMTPDGGGMAVLNVESHEELWEKINAFPGTRYLDHDFFPLMSHRHFYNRLLETPFAL